MRETIRSAAALLALALCAAPAAGQQTRTLFEAPCTASADSPVTEPSTGRTYLLDYPCDLRENEDVTFVLSLHGGGSSGNWQRRYFPAFDQKERHRLVIAAPYSPIRRWTEDDDAYLRNIVTAITDELGSENIRAFWLAGHSQGGATSRRLVCTDFFARRVDGFLSLSGGRLGGAAPRAPDAGRPRQANEPPADPAAAAAAPAAPAPAGDPECEFSHIFAIGEHEIQSLPASSTWADRLGCDARARRPEVVDDRPGYVHDGGRQNPGSRAWGLLPRPGTAQVFVYGACNGGRVVADVVRLDKGHTEGLEPAVTEALVSLMVSASGGRISGATAARAVPPVDYSDESSWLCRPGRADTCTVDLGATVVSADGTLSVERWSADPSAPIDCFYVYPTVSTDPGTNSDMNPDEAERRVVHQQFARFGSVCRLYAPMYRQVTLAGLRERRTGSGDTSLDQGLAYEDVLDAFRHYIANDNQGRGFVLIGHSQGSYILSRLIAQEIDGGVPLGFVSALLLGATVTVARGQDVGGSFRTIPLCKAATQVGCVVTFVSFRSTTPPPANTLFGRTTDPVLEAACTDPTALAGTPGQLRAYLSADGNTIVGPRRAGPWITSSSAIETPFVSVPGLLTARCATNENATYLEITVHGDASDPRADDISGDLTPQWGLHLIDVNLAMGSLLDVVRGQAAAWRARS